MAGDAETQNYDFGGGPWTPPPAQVAPKPIDLDALAARLAPYYAQYGLTPEQVRAGLSIGSTTGALENVTGGGEGGSTYTYGQGSPTATVYAPGAQLGGAEGRIGSMYHVLGDDGSIAFSQKYPDNSNFKDFATAALSALTMGVGGAFMGGADSALTELGSGSLQLGETAATGLGDAVGTAAGGGGAATSTGAIIDAGTQVGGYAVGPDVWSSEMAQAMTEMGMSPAEISAAQAEIAGGAGTGTSALSSGSSAVEGATGSAVGDGAGGMSLQEGAYPTSVTDGGWDWAKIAKFAKDYGLPISQVVGGILSKINSNKTAGNLDALQRGTDPFGPYRAQYADRLNSMVADPAGSVASMPAYAAGIQAIKTAGAGHGYMGSGNMDAAMLKYGGNMWEDQAKFFAGLAGANISPTQNAQFGALQSQNQSAGDNGIMNIIRGLTGMAPLLANSVGRN